MFRADVRVWQGERCDRALYLARRLGASGDKRLDMLDGKKEVHPGFEPGLLEVG